MRVHDLARELKISSKELMAHLQASGVAVKSHSSTIDQDTVARVKQHFLVRTGKPAAPAPEPQQKISVFPPQPSVPRPPEAEAPSTPPLTIGPPPKPVTKEPPKHPEPRRPEKPAAKKTIYFKGPIIVRDYAERLGMKPNQLIAELMMMNIFAGISERLEIKVAQQVAEKHGFVIEHEKKPPETKPSPSQLIEEEADKPEDMQSRPPVVTFLGHIDHGKTSLLDRIRNTAVAKSEAGGITQHIGAYTVEHDGKKITFLDTPGHAAFTAMRARGANMTDIAVIVIAADDGVMPQTEEAIKHAQAAQTTIMAAINKIDLPAANPDKVKSQLQAIGLTPEEWGGNVICVEVSALTGKNIDHLLEMILLQADMLELKANPRARARGYVIEAQMEPGMGPIATLLITKGTLSVGDVILCGPYWGRVKALVNDRGIKVRKAVPSMPIRCMGLSGVPKAGELFQCLADDMLARKLAEERIAQLRDTQMAAPKKASLETIFAHLAADQSLELRLILKCDTQGSLEAIQKMLGEIKSEKVSISIILAAVGNVTENDVMLASASEAIIAGFNVSKEAGVAAAEKREGVEIRLYSIIYDLLDQIKEAMSGMLQPVIREKYVGRADVRQVFQIAKKDRVAGSLVSDGRVHMRCKARVKRKGDILYEGAVATLKRFQDQVNEVREGQECGIQLDNFRDFEEGDVIEFYEVEKIPQTL
jgi:translation initiation factor IF-2